MISEYIDKLVGADRKIIEQAKLRILARCSPPPSHSDFGGLYDPSQFNLDIPNVKFSLLWHNQPSFSGSMQVIGTYNSESKVFHWGWKNRFLSKAATNKIKNFCESTPELVDLINLDYFEITSHLASSLAGWIALKLGYMGIYHAEVNKNQLTFVGIESLNPDNGETYCVICFANSQDGKRLISFASGLAVCERCVTTFQDIIDQRAGADTQSSGFCMSCIICDENSGLIFGPHSALCPSCVSTAKDALA